MAVPPRYALQTLARLFGYDPLAVISVYMDQYVVTVKYRIDRGDGTFYVQEDGFFIPDPIYNPCPQNVGPCQVDVTDTVDAVLS
jgi:hypothetical protein